MAANDRWAKHQAEYEWLIASGVFPPRSNLARFFEYVCRKYFEGQETVSEHEIAVEALGRRPDFNPKQDAIVRVEAHRLRKRLSEHYRKEGAGRSCRLMIPARGYLPVFTEEETAEAPPAPAIPAVTRAVAMFRRLPRKAIVAAALLIAVAGVLLVLRSNAPIPGAAAVPAPAKAVAPLSEVRIMAGSRAPDYTDRLGRVWSADRFFDGGEIRSARYRGIFRTADTQLYLSAREGPDFGYDIPLQPGFYELRLHFAETLYGEDSQEGGGESSRVFTISANGAPLIANFDPLSDAGGSNTATVRVFAGVSPGPDGMLHLRFRPQFTTKAVAFVNAIEVLPANSRAMLPIRWVASRVPKMDSASRLWLPDQFSYGGRLRGEQETVAGTEDTELYRSERYGHFSYAIPVADGTYSLTLHFAEHWFGIENRSRGGARLFDVFCNGAALLRNFSIQTEAGGSLKALKRTFRGLKPNAQGKLLLTFVPIQDYASISALEVLDENRR